MEPQKASLSQSHRDSMFQSEAWKEFLQYVEDLCVDAKRSAFAALLTGTVRDARVSAVRALVLEEILSYQENCQNENLEE